MDASLSSNNSFPVPVFQTRLGTLSRFALPYFRNSEVSRSTLETKKSFNEDEKVDDIRTPSTAVHFHPSVWDGFDFVASSPTTMSDTEGRHNELKNQVKTILLSSTSTDPFHQLDLIDKIQRLGIAYHFEVEIQRMLERSHNDDYTSFSHKNGDCSDLHFVSLRFRLLRQAGYYVSPAVFNQFTDESGQFHGNLALDVPRMLSLYEASYLGFNGENIMDDAMTFTTNYLNSVVNDLTSPLALQVQQALQTPLHHSTERVMAKQYITTYSNDISRNETLLKFAKLDYNLVQSLHQREINELSRWWKQINIKSKVPFDVRDRVVEGYAMINSFSFEPEFSQGRIHLGKIWGLLLILDDAHDVYGDLAELELLCDAIQRWDDADLNRLPNHMQVIFHEVLNLVNDIEGDVKKQGHFIGGPYLKTELQILAKVYFEEAKFLFRRNPPTLENWTPLSVASGGIHPFLVASAMNMGELATKELLDWISSLPKIIKCANMMVRLMDDIGSFKLEQERGILVTNVTCYMEEHGVSESDAVKSLRKIITRLWKDMNEEFLRINNPAPLRFHKLLLNTIRMLVLCYGDGNDAHTISNSRTKEIITSLFVHPIPTP